MKKPKRPKLPRYLSKILYLQRLGIIPASVGLHQVSIYHDDDCQHWDNRPCDCDPDIKLRWSQPAIGRN